MITSKMQDVLNTHACAEYYSSYLYLSMSAYCEAQTYKGFAKWLRIQSAEEMAHAHKILDYILERGGSCSLKNMEAPPAEFNGVFSVFEAVQKHEQRVSQMVRDLYDVSVAEKDVAAQIFLQWFISEQVEEEARVKEIVDKLHMVGDRPGTILYLDKEYGKREA